MPGFVEPMECLPVAKIPSGPDWIYEVKLDGYRAIGVMADGKATLFSRLRNNLNRKFPAVAKALESLPDGTVIDGEVVALDDQGRPNFHLLSGGKAPICFYIFDLLYLEKRNLIGVPLSERRDALKSIPINPPLKVLEYFKSSAEEMLETVRQFRLEGVVAKRIVSRYEPGKRSGAWAKHRINQLGGFAIGGFIPGSHGVDSIILGQYEGKKLMYLARVRAGLVPALRRELYGRLQPLVIETCPFANLPERGKSRWGEKFNAEKMKKCVWVEPKLSAEIEFLEQTKAGGLRHAKFVRLVASSRSS
jgi:DNA ligase D-like protein (predicted ligase)